MLHVVSCALAGMFTQSTVIFSPMFAAAYYILYWYIISLVQITVCTFGDLSCFRVSV